MTFDLAPVEAAPPLLGARVEGAGTRFGLYAQPADVCAVRLFAPDGSPLVDHAMQALGDGFFEVYVPAVREGALYKFVLDGRELPDPFARFLPRGVHGPAEVMVDRYAWRSGPGVARPLPEHVIYELHVGTFTEAGTYAGARERLPELARLGVTALELMPLAAFPGQRGWGYEGVALYAPYAPYGRPDELRAFVDAAHALGLSVFLDVVYNHFGPSGNYLPAYCPEFLTAEYRNAWGDAPNYAHPVLRRLVLENALYWLTELRFDGLRLDATHAIFDPSEPDVLRALADAVREQAPGKLLIAEDNRNDGALVTRRHLDAIWADDFHHQVRVCLTGEKDGYYAAYRPSVADLARVIERGWLYEGDVYAPTGHPRGKPADALPASAFVYCIQNHDQVGNRAFGDRLGQGVSPEQYRAVSTLLLFLPMTPLLFMGQEWAATSPFLFFTDHDPELGRLVREGRREEFKDFEACRDPAMRARIPDPQARETFEASRLRWDERGRDEHAHVLALYETLLQLRASDPVLKVNDRRALRAEAVGDVLVVRRAHADAARVLLVNFGAAPVARASLPLGLPAPRVIFHSDPAHAGGDAETVPGHSAVILAA